MYFTEHNIIFFTAGVFTFAVLCFLYKRFRQVRKSDWQYKLLDVTESDLQVIDSVEQNFVEENWNKGDDRLCIPSKKLSLFCAIAFASKNITGTYTHWGVVTQELRLTIEETYPERWSKHPLMDFNNHEDTNSRDILNVLEVTRERLIKR